MKRRPRYTVTLRRADGAVMRTTIHYTRFGANRRARRHERATPEAAGMIEVDRG